MPVRLSRGDLVEYLELGGWFRRVKDPILLEFLKVWGAIEVEGLRQSKIRDKLIIKYQKQKRRISEYKGYLAEIHMSQVLLSSQDKIIPAKFFNTGKDVQMPWRFTYVHHRSRLESGKGKEIDVLGAAGIEQWICQSKWTTGKKTGIDVLKEMQNQAQLLLMEKDAEIIRLWLFSHEGLTDEAVKYANEHGIFWSARKEFDELLGFAGLRRLPEV